jgi:hypothetical protein
VHFDRAGGGIRDAGGEFDGAVVGVDVVDRVAGQDFLGFRVRPVRGAGQAPARASAEPTTTLTRALLACGVVAGPLHIVVAALQALARGFDICFVFARRFAAARQPGWAAYSVVTGVVFLAAFGAVAALPDQAGANVGLAVAVALGWGWGSVLSAQLISRLSPAER